MLPVLCARGLLSSVTAMLLRVSQSKIRDRICIKFASSTFGLLSLLKISTSMPGKNAKHSAINQSAKGETKNLQPEESGFELRMRRAMQEAEDEMGDADEDEFHGFGEDLDEDEEVEEKSTDDGSSNDNEEPMFEGENESMDSDADDEEMTLEPSKSKNLLQPNHLPDELFAAAFSSATTKRKIKSVEGSQLTKKRKRSNKGHKDKIVGCVPDSGGMRYTPYRVPLDLGLLGRFQILRTGLYLHQQFPREKSRRLLTVLFQ